MAGLSGEQLAAWVVASCERQGVPVKVTDSVVVSQVTVLLGGRADGIVSECAWRKPAGRPPTQSRQSGSTRPGSTTVALGEPGAMTA
jgi:hypothetical protein